mgnify:FL=1
MEKKGSLFNLKYFLLLAILVTVDLWTKQYVVNNFSVGQTKDLILPFIDLLLIYNSGIAFGILDNNNELTSYFLLILGIIIVLYIINLAINEQSIKKTTALMIISGGALGNIIDRAVDNYVTDFLHLKINNYSFFIFNLADAFITIGAILIIYFEIKTNFTNVETN